MELICAIAEYLDVPNEFVTIDKVVGDCCFFSVRGAGYNCFTVRGGKFLKKNSVRKD